MAHDRNDGRVYSVTTLGRQRRQGHELPVDPRLPRPRGPRLGLAGVVAAGAGVLAVYLVLSLLAHLFVAAVFWLPSVLVAGLVVRALGRTRVSPGLQLVVGLVVMVVVHGVLRAAL